MKTNQEELKDCKEGSRLKWIGDCPNMKALPSSFCDDCERYECAVCGQHFKIYDEDIK